MVVKKAREWNPLVLSMYNLTWPVRAYCQLLMITDALFHIKHVPSFGFSAKTVSILRSSQEFEEGWGKIWPLSKWRFRQWGCIFNLPCLSLHQRASSGSSLFWTRHQRNRPQAWFFSEKQCGLHVYFSLHLSLLHLTSLDQYVQFQDQESGDNIAPTNKKPKVHTHFYSLSSNIFWFLTLQDVKAMVRQQKTVKPETGPIENTGDASGQFLKDRCWAGVFIPTLMHAFYTSCESFTEFTLDSLKLIETVQNSFNISFPNVDFALSSNNEVAKTVCFNFCHWWHSLVDLHIGLWPHQMQKVEAR